MRARGPRSLTTWRRHAARQLKTSRIETLALLKRLPEDAILQPRTQDQWSVKDVLGHLLACDEETVRRFALIARGRGGRIKWFESMADADRFNARTVARLRRASVRAILGRMARVRADLIRRFQRLPAAALDDPSHAYPVTEWLPAPGWSHERDHAGEIKAWWARQPKPRARPGASRA